MDHFRRQTMPERGGVVLAISTYLQSFVISYGRGPNNNYVQITLLVQERLISFCSIYAPNSSVEYSIIWSWLTSLPDAEWVIGGDFNMVE